MVEACAKQLGFESVGLTGLFLDRLEISVNRPPRCYPGQFRLCFERPAVLEALFVQLLSDLTPCLKHGQQDHGDRREHK